MNRKRRFYNDVGYRNHEGRFVPGPGVRDGYEIYRGEEVFNAARRVLDFGEFERVRIFPHGAARAAAGVWGGRGGEVVK